jgi:putative effector of murein hydrolase
MDLPLVNIYYISAVGFYQNLVQPNTVTFITSLYKINQIIKEKESELSR